MGNNNNNNNNNKKIVDVLTSNLRDACLDYGARSPLYRGD